MGLLLSHICMVRIWGDMIQISRKGSPPPTTRGQRGEVKGFTRDSRFRLLCLMHQVEFKKAAFVTLTYPGVWSSDPRDWKNDLVKFRGRLERHFGKVRVVWRLEFQKRGAPHYHLILFDPPFVPKEWLSKAWYDSVGSGLPEHLEAGTQIKLVCGADSPKLVMKYVAKYTAKFEDQKTESEVTYVGRHWGKWNIGKIAPVEVETGATTAFGLVDTICGGSVDASPYYPGDPLSCRLFGSSLGDRDFATRVVGILKEKRLRARG